MVRTWLIVALIVSLVVNAFLIGLIIGNPPVKLRVPRTPFPPLPPMIKGEVVPGLRAHFFPPEDSANQHLCELRRELVMEMASDSTDREKVDRLIDEIINEQRALQESIIDYIDSLKCFIPEKDRAELHHWIMESFGERKHMRQGRSSRQIPRNIRAPDHLPQDIE